MSQDDNRPLLNANKTKARLARRLALSLTGVLPLLMSTVVASTDQADLSVGMKTLPLLTDKIQGSASVAIIYDPTIATSVEEAKEIKAIFDGGFEAPGNLKLTAIVVPVNELGKIASSRIAVITGGLNTHYDAIGAAASADHILTMSTDLACVQANKCIIGIVSKPHVQIYYSKDAADAAQISFGQVFTMLVTSVR